MSDKDRTSPAALNFAVLVRCSIIMPRNQRPHFIKACKADISPLCSIYHRVFESDMRLRSAVRTGVSFFRLNPICNHILRTCFFSGRGKVLANSPKKRHLVSFQLHNTSAPRHTSERAEWTWHVFSTGLSAEAGHPSVHYLGSR